MKKEEVEFLFLDDNDDFEDDFMLNNKKKKKEVKEVIPEKQEKKKFEEIETLMFEEEIPKKKEKEIKIEKLELEEEPKKINLNETIDLEELEVPRRRSKEEHKVEIEEPKEEKVKTTTVKTKSAQEEKVEEKVEEIIEEEPAKKAKKGSKKEKVKKEKVKTEKTKKEKKKKEKKPVKKFVFYTQLSFCLISILFIIGCCVFYGSRLIKYYKIYNPKTETGEKITLIASSILDGVKYETEGSGIYRLSGASVYKGTDVKNYVRYSNLTWRIMSINVDGTLELILDENVNSLMYGAGTTTFKDSDILSYLNEKILPKLNKDYLTATPYCLGDVADMKSVSCSESATDSYIRLASITEYINSLVDNDSYMVNGAEYWLYNSNEEQAWHTNEGSLSLSNSTESYAVKPVVRIKNSTILISGDGSKENPYVIEKDEDKPVIGSYVKLGDDNWMVYDLDEETVSLVSVKGLTNVMKYSSSKNTYDITDKTSVAYYLNNTYLNSLSYKDILNKHKWNTGKYEKSYKDVEKSTVEASVGMLSVEDIKLYNMDKMYYLLTPSKTGYVYFFDGELIESKVNMSRNIKPTININRDILKGGKGTLSDPFVMGMEE